MPSATPTPRPYITPMPLAGFTLKSCYRAALTRARFAHTWEDRLDALATAERLRHRILAEQGRYRLSVADYSNKMVRASAHKSAVRRVFSLDGQCYPPFSPALQERLAGLRTSAPAMRVAA